jgi:hypothetical protein
MKTNFLVAGAIAWAALMQTNAAQLPTEGQTVPTTPNSTTILLSPYTPTSNFTLDLGVANPEYTDWDPTSDEAFNAKNRKYFEIYFGWNQFRNSDGFASIDPTNPQTTELNGWNSMTWGFGFGTRSRIGDGKLGIRYGLQFNWHFYRFQRANTIVVKNTDPGMLGISFVEQNALNNKKSTYRNTYLDLPILLDFDTRQSANKGLTLAFGGYGGIRLGSSTNREYDDPIGDKVQEKRHTSNFTNLWRYGLMGQVGFGSFKITGKMDLNTVFEQDNVTTPDYQAASITIGWVMP